MIHYTTKFRFQANQIVNQIFSNSPKKQEKKTDMKCINQDGISILELRLPPPSNMKFQIWFTIWISLEKKNWGYSQLGP